VVWVQAVAVARVEAEGAVAEAPPAAGRMAWVEVAGERVKEGGEAAGREVAREVVSSGQAGLEWEAWEGETAPVTQAMEEVGRGAEKVVLAEVGKVEARAAAPPEDSVAAARVEAAPSSSWSSRGAWTRTGGRLHLR